jgi:hypothetical protein
MTGTCSDNGHGTDPLLFITLHCRKGTSPPSTAYILPCQLSSPRACAVSYPTKVAEGLIWVWASSGPGAEQEAAAAEWKGLAPILDSKGESEGHYSNHRWYFRCAGSCICTERLLLHFADSRARAHT